MEKDCGGKATKPASISSDSKKSHTTDGPVVGNGESKKSHATTDEPVVTTTRKETAEKEAKQADQLVKTVTKRVTGVLQKVKLQGKKSAMDFLDAFVTEFVKAIPADLKTNGRRLFGTITKTMDL